MRTGESHDVFGRKVVRVVAEHPALKIPKPRAQQDSHGDKTGNQEPELYNLEQTGFGN